MLPSSSIWKLMEMVRLSLFCLRTQKVLWKGSGRRESMRCTKLQPAPRLRAQPSTALPSGTKQLTSTKCTLTQQRLRLRKLGSVLPLMLTGKMEQAASNQLPFTIKVRHLRKSFLFLTYSAGGTNYPDPLMLFLKGAINPSISYSLQCGSSMLQVLSKAQVSISTCPILPYSPLMLQKGWSSVTSQYANSPRKYLEQACCRHCLSICLRSMFMEANLALVGLSRYICLALWNSIFPTTSRALRKAMATTLHSVFSFCSDTRLKYTSSSCMALLVFRPSTTSTPYNYGDWMLQYHFTVSENCTTPRKQTRQ